MTDTAITLNSHPIAKSKEMQIQKQVKNLAPFKNQVEQVYCCKKAVVFMET